MVAHRWLTGIIVLTMVTVAAFTRPAAASPARRLARRGVVVAPAAVAVAPATVAVVPSPFLLRPAPLVIAGVPATAPTVVLGRRGRVRSVILPPVGPPVPVMTLSAGVAPEPAVVIGSVGPSDTLAPQAAATPPAPAPGTLPTETGPAPLPTPRPAPAGDVQPAAAELDIPDGTRSVLVQPAGGDAPAGNDR